MSWPPTLAELKNDKNIPQDDETEDDALTAELEAAIEFVQDKRPAFNYDGDVMSELPAPTATLKLGTIRLAGRWFTRRRSPDGLVDMGDLGAGRIPSVDPDIERMLGIGRYAKGLFA